MKRLAVLFGFALFLLMPTSVAAAECQFVLGFKTLRDLVGHDVVGECLENEHHNEIGDSVQQTTGGLLAWRKADNWTAFTDGYRTWVNGPIGLVQRLNTERFEWEADYAPGGGIATPTPTTAAVSTPTPIPVPVPKPESSLAIEQAIAAIPWVQDGMDDVVEPHIVAKMRELGAASPQVFWAWMELVAEDVRVSKALAKLAHVTSVAKSDGWAALQMLQTPFVESRASLYDIRLLKLMAFLESQRPGSLRQVMSRPELHGGITDENARTFALLAFQHMDPEVSSAIAALSWTQDEVGRPAHLDRLDHRAAEASEFELPALLELVTLLSRSRQAFVDLVSYPWMQDEVTSRELTIISFLGSIAWSDSEAADRLTTMPFLETIGTYKFGILDIFNSLTLNDPEGVHWILSHPLLAGGITDERIAVLALLQLERQDPEAAASIWSLPWIDDGIAASETSAVLVMQSAAESKLLLQALARKPWIQDGISSDERTVIRSLWSISGKVTRRDEAAGLAILNMPFLESVEGTDAAAISSLSALHWEIERSYLQELLSHPTLRDGIRDEHAVLLSVLGNVIYLGPEWLHFVLQPGNVTIWERTITLHEFGNVNLAVVSTSPEAAGNLDWLEQAVRHHVVFLGSPLPKSYVALWVHDRGGGGGGPSGIISVGSLSSPRTIAHEVAHIYWSFAPRWMQEGPASFLESVSENKRIGTPIEPHNDGYCSHTNTLLGLDQYLQRRVPSFEQCEYSLGSALFVDLYHSLGDQAFRDGFRRLYLRLEIHESEEVCFGLESGACYVKLAFVTDASPEAAAIALPIINRRYYGSEHGP